MTMMNPIKARTLSGTATMFEHAMCHTSAVIATV
jgi:hypothetical protein